MIAELKGVASNARAAKFFPHICKLQLHFMQITIKALEQLSTHLCIVGVDGHDGRHIGLGDHYRGHDVWYVII